METKKILAYTGLNQYNGFQRSDGRMIRYYKLFDLLNRNGKKKSDLREILSSKTVAKLSKGEYVSGEIIDKLCLYLKCQPNDIMEVFEELKVPNEDGTYRTLELKHELPNYEEYILHELYEERARSYEKVRKEMQENNK